MEEAYKGIAARKQRERDDKIPPAWRLREPISDDVADVTSVPRTCGILTEAELDITENYEAEILVQGLAKKRWSSVEVATAFCKRAAIVQQVTNCLTEIFFDDALSRAKYLDDYLAEKGKPFGPLHGLPISIKDCFNVTSYDSSIGLSALAFKPAKENEVLVQLLLSAGAILYVKTTTPQGMLCFDTHSFLWGRTKNPHNRALTAGGSSGGEGALIAMNGSILGIGTDVGGSIRVPSACSSIYGLKPTTGRVPKSSTTTEMFPENMSLPVTAVAGPMARNVKDLGFFFKVLESLEPWRFDYKILPFPASPKLWAPGKKLSIGIMRNDGIMTPLPPVTAALGEVAQKLSIAGHAVNEISLPGLIDVFNLLRKFFTINGNKGVCDALESVGEPWSPWLASRMKRASAGKLEELWALNIERARVEAVVLKELWERDRERFDVLLAPVQAHPATPHDKFVGLSYAGVWNLLDYPAGSIPVRKVTTTDLGAELPDKSLGELDDKNRELWSDKESRTSFLNAPIAVQVVSRKGTETELCRAMEIIDSVLSSTSTEDQASKL